MPREKTPILRNEAGIRKVLIIHRITTKIIKYKQIKRKQIVERVCVASST